MTTTSADVTKQQELNRGKPDKIATVFQAMKLGNMLAGSVKVTAAALAPAATFDITTAAVRAASTISGLDRESSDNLPPIMVVKTLRVTASATANSVGSYIVSDAAGTALSPTAGANVGIALLSDDGKSLTFPSTVTAFVIEYVPRPAVDITSSLYPVVGVGLTA